jgi:hypothetical protein
MILLSETQTQFFTILFDETKNNENDEELPIRVKYWSQLFDRVVCVHIKIFYLLKKGCR